MAPMLWILMGIHIPTAKRRKAMDMVMDMVMAMVISLNTAKKKIITIILHRALNI